MTRRSAWKLDDADAYDNRAVARETADRNAAAADFQRYLDLGGGQRDGDQAQVKARIRRLKKR